MAAKAREENEELKKQVAELQARLAGGPPASLDTPPTVV
jgi:BMFP domain-containing protein YqiC